MSDTSSSTASATSSSATASSTSSSSNSGPTSSPLLFFVALGFGVVFTNLWIIVGVKYCFRYNQRNRQLRALNENGEPIDLANMNGRRRRREKKLMTMEEVNERFPLMKYKLWRSKREAEGLPTEGGVTAPPSRAVSIRSKEAARTSFQTARVSKESARVHAEPSDATIAGADASEPRKSMSVQPAVEKQPEAEARRASAATGEDEEDEDDDPIRNAVAPEMLASPGDNCAICIDTLEDDDDVRGLTCGHAFHASCVDPWLTSRRAKCPLCAADYYVQKPRPEGAEDPNVVAPAQPPPTWIGTRAGMSIRTMQILTRGPAMFNNQSGNTPRRFLGGSERPTSQGEGETTGWRSRLRMPRFGRAAPQQQYGAAAAGEHGVPEELPTPGELEAGQNNVVR
ncbi:hypothetical protein AMS68_000964 [Peltaster fructicola]|uniref:RING-type domain-containing protein n=1 Tax=Peltaster fructicola TaxID=286661 RepID=A0A6H0XL24_9PEZI|nr:hypothetical protein AMS68_000964 [Peltaster fructicola]